VVKARVSESLAGKTDLEGVSMDTRQWNRAMQLNPHIVIMRNIEPGKRGVIVCRRLDHRQGLAESLTDHPAPAPLGESAWFEHGLNRHACYRVKASTDCRRSRE
jgi:hypothetical protein